MDYSIFYPTPIDKIEDVNNDNIDVCVYLSNGKCLYLRILGLLL